VGLDSKGNEQIFQRQGMSIPVTETMFDVKKRLADMDKMGVDMQVLSLTVPGVERVDAKLGVKLSRAANDEFSEIVSKHEKRFAAAASLPFQDPAASLEEIDRAIGSLSLNAIEIFSNVNGEPLDSKRFWPIFERAEKLDVPVFLHPTIPAATAGMEEFDLVEAIGFVNDTSVALTRMILSGLLDKFRKLKIVAGHLGGTFPYIIGRLDQQYSLTPEAQVNVSKPPSSYLDRICFDTTTNLPECIEFGSALMSPDNMVLGSDYPIWPGKRAVKVVETAGLSRKARSKIFSKTAKRLLINKKWKN
jgi:predicted TIM-barrel fold metal-dependent hydrolase